MKIRFREIFPRFTEELKRLRHLERLAEVRPPIPSRRVQLFILAILLDVILVSLLFEHSELQRQAIFMTGIFVLAALLWVTESLPLFATAILIIGLEIILLANPGNWAGLGFEGGFSPDYREFLAPLSDPVIVLFFGGFILAHAVLKEGVDKAMASGILKAFGSKPFYVMLGLMLITALFSMWMSNTATTAMMITLVYPMLEQIPKGDPLRKGLLLAIPFAANIGGMGTPIASPPNAVAVSFLQQAGYEINFLEWVLIAAPLMAFLLVFAWLLLYNFFKPIDPSLELKPTPRKIDGRGWYVIIVMLITVLLWLSDQWHGLSTAVVALFPAIAFTATGLLGRSDVNSLEWHILILIMGGIALGVGMQLTGLDEVFVSYIPGEGSVVLAAMVIATILFSTFISNTAAANLLLPIGISFALQNTEIGMPGPVQLAVSIALSASLAMALPISTPPNTIAYSKGDLVTGDFTKSGIIIGGLAAMLIIALGNTIISFWTTY
ncbi:sodium-dependent dicarboxylate transporter 2/3/5 [Catalinimonas alkaloidigena]|uniref:SLC13 family permease n=1 Tax=Catalinimonas alkaloidigena TaxID=1075417 RepID=UPI0024056A2D|nr:SLC13 family permease [Catalinimonas alkaloidigena]MDF9800145.1 sodium-dependent dicarboxylate transporter 2/3/5 [Catalinimonas alkaloidigena]